MLHRLSCAALFASLLVLSASAGAEPADAAKPAVAVKPSTTAEARRDPHGIKGISPFTEALNRGDTALLARDLDGAIAAYRDAISKDAQNALGQYRLGEALILKGDLHEAELAFSAGLRLVNAASLGLKAKLQFASADLRERQKAYDQASAQWTEYETFTTAQKDAQGFPASGSERKRVVEAWKKLSADSLEVKARIEKGVKAADEAVRKSSK
jgi:tetratricopeptide (TPR) repeat protein